MKLTTGLVLAALSLLALLPVAQAATSTEDSSSGSVTYSVQAEVNGTAKAVAVTETVGAGTTAGDSVVTLAISGAMSNLTYSRVVNSSLELLPYLPAVSVTSYNYSGNGYAVQARVSQQADSQVSFQGKSYTMTNYAFSATVTSTNGTEVVSGTVSAFPSDLVYSVTAQGTGSSVTATLTSTNLSLDGSSASPALQATTAGVGISLAVGAVALSLGVRLRGRHGRVGPKPDHWVD